MIIKENESIAKYTTFRMGGTAEKMYFPESVEELEALVREDKEILRYMIGGGSNLLVNDHKVFERVLCLRSFNNRFEHLGGGKYYIGASVRLQKVINTINADGFGGIEYLYSVPALIGGAVYMNAGRGKKHNKCLSDYIVSVDYYLDGSLHTMRKADCKFAYRSSCFQEMQGVVIVGAHFEFPEVDIEEAKAKVQERIDLCKRVQDSSAPNFGTVFCESNKYIMEVVRRLHWDYKNGVTFSSKTKNWLLHKEGGSFEQAIKLLEKVKKTHKLLGQKCRAEVKIWE